ncbi:putative Methyltransferase [Seiridium cardinale]|uniref:Methyltransferase n=1 Tax=Seiridium cardinale TaxID=138064 RepID=A0ABR2Y5G6_9PEZI
MAQVQSQNTAVTADISYFEPLEIHAREKPYISNVPFIETHGPWNNLNQVKHETTIVDIRGRESDFSLERNGFEYVKHTFEHPPTEDIDDFNHPYVTEIEHFLQDHFKPSMVFMYDAIIRKVGLDGYFQQADAAHIDHTPENCQWRLEMALKKRELDLKPRRIRIVTAWKPLMERVTHWPIAVCDASTVSSEECHAIDTVFPHYASELYHIGYSDMHKWFYLNEQTNEEILLMQVYDSNKPDMTVGPYQVTNWVVFDDVLSPLLTPRQPIHGLRKGASLLGCQLTHGLSAQPSPTFAYSVLSLNFHGCTRSSEAATVSVKCCADVNTLQAMVNKVCDLDAHLASLPALHAQSLVNLINK